MTRLTVNGEPVEYRMDPSTPLLWALRDASNLTGTKYGCGVGQCGACTVHADGEAVRSCLRPLGSLEGADIVTIEGLASGRDHPVQVALLAENVVQCGFCLPGVVMAAAALLRRNASPTDAEVHAAMTNLCRCGVYPRLSRAIARAARAMRGEELPAADPPAPLPANPPFSPPAGAGVS